MTTSDSLATDESPPRLATFTRMQEGTADDWRVIGADFSHFSKKLPDRVMAHLRLLDGDYGGFPIDRLKHSLQTATRAAKAGRDDEYVVCALLHDIGEFVRNEAHHKHSHYIIEHSEIMGLTPVERSVVANVARYREALGASGL